MNREKLDTMVKTVKNIKTKVISDIKTKVIPEVKLRFQKDLERLLKPKKKLECICALQITDIDLKIINMDLLDGFKITFYKCIKLSSQEKDKFIQEKLQSFRGQLSNDIILDLQDQDVDCHRLSIAVMPESEIPKALEWQIKEFVSFDITKAIINYQVIGQKKEMDDSKKLEVMVSVTNRDIIERYFNIIKQAGFNCLKVSLYPLNILHLLKFDSAVEEKRIISILDISQTYTNIYIYKGDFLTFSRKIAIGLNHFMNSLPDSVILKLDLQNVEYTQMMALLRPILERFTQEVKRSLYYYTSEFNEQDITQMYLMGQGAGIKNFDRYLNQELKIKCDNLKLTENIHIEKEEDFFKNQFLYLPIVGAALGYNDKVNILPFELRSTGMEEIEKVSLRMIFFIIIVIFLLFNSIVSFRVKDYRKRLANADLHLKTLSEAKQLYNLIIEKTNLVNLIKRGNVPSEWILKELSNLTPSQIILKDLKLEQRENRVSLRGIVLKSVSGEDPLTDFIKNLSSSPIFKKANLKTVTKLDTRGELVSDFEIAITLIE